MRFKDLERDEFQEEANWKARVGRYTHRDVEGGIEVYDGIEARARDGVTEAWLRSTAWVEVGEWR